MKSIGIWLVISLLACLQGAACLAQESVSPSATGAVVGANSQPLPGVPVQVEGPLGRTFAVTDSTGTWALYNLPPGKYVVQPLAGVVGNDFAAQSFKVEKRGYLQFLQSAPVAVKVPEIKIQDAP